MLHAQGAQWPQASQVPQAHTAPASVTSPPPPVQGGSHRWEPRRFTRRSQRGDSMMRPGPRLTLAADATATTGAGNHARRDSQACHHNPNPNHSPQPNPSSSADAPAKPGATGDDPDTNEGTAIQLRYLATSVDDLTARDIATEPGALAVRAWAESTRRNWRRDLQRVGRTALMYADLDAASALAKHLTMLAAQGRQSATLRGVVSSVRMCETLGIIDTVVTPLHWAICKAADRAYAHPPPRRIWTNAHTLQLLDARTSGPFGTAVVALPCVGLALCWRVSEAASVRPSDLATPWRVAFYDEKTQHRWITARLSHWGGSCRKRLHAIVQHGPGWVPLFASTAEVQHALRAALMGTVWHSVAWHAFRRLGAAALAATGAAMAVTARWGRWKSERQAAEYATPPLEWEWELPALLP